VFQHFKPQISAAVETTTADDEQANIDASLNKFIAKWFGTMDKAGSETALQHILKQCVQPPLSIANIDELMSQHPLAAARNKNKDVIQSLLCKAQRPLPVSIQIVY
jgi:hypothetical protein